MTRLMYRSPKDRAKRRDRAHMPASVRDPEWINFCFNRRGKPSWLAREITRYWNSEKNRVRRAMELGETPEPSRPRRQAEWDYW